MARRVSRPLEAIRQGAERYSRGDFTRHIPPSPCVELEVLTATLNQMADQLRERLAELTRQKGEGEAVLGSLVEGVIAVDREERVVSVNRAALAWIRLSVDKAAGSHLQEALRNHEVESLVREVLGHGESREREIAWPGGGGTLLQVRGTAWRDQAGQQAGVVLTLHDVTRLRRLERVRSDFVANVSHELKTPITAIQGFVETLRDGALDDRKEAERFLAIVGRQADRLNTIIEDLLLLSRLEQGDASALPVVLETGSLREIIQAAVETCAPRAEERQMRVTWECPEGLSARINARLFAHALINLVDNAVKYSDPGREIAIRAEAREGEILLGVRDQGWGIGSEHLPRLFERFYRVDKARSRQFGGSGLGLAIAKHILSIHGGQVTVESELGKGSVFTLHLPRG